MVNFLAPVCGIEGLEDIVYYATVVVKVLQIFAPIALIIWGSVDFIKSIIAGDANKMAAARKPFIQRLISALIVFLIPWFTNIILNGLADAGNQWATCYSVASKK